MSPYSSKKLSPKALLLLSAIWTWNAFSAASAEQPAREAPQAGDRVDLAAWGASLEARDSLGVEWENPRQVDEVRLVLPASAAGPADLPRVQWWGSVWPNNGSGGWMKLDDPWNGRWVRAPGKFVAGDRPGEWVFRFPALDKSEWPEALEAKAYAGGTPPAFRRTLKLRVVFTTPESGNEKAAAVPTGARLAVYGASRWREASFDLCMRQTEPASAGRLEVTNGMLLGLTALPCPSEVKVEQAAWTARGVSSAFARLRMAVRYAENADPASNDLTRVTVRLGTDPRAVGFSFVPQDVLKEGAIRLPDFGALVAESSRELTPANDRGPSGPHWDKTVRRRVAERPEATRDSAMAGIPRLEPPRWVPLGVPSARQEVVVGPLGDWSMWRESLHTEARDTKRLGFRGNHLDAILDTRAEPRFDGGDRQDARRYLEDDCLPVIHVRWHTGAVQYHHALMATILSGNVGDDDTRRGDETVVLLSKLELKNTSGAVETATINLRYSHEAPIVLGEDGIVAIKPAQAPPGLIATRGQVIADGRADRPAEDWTVRPSAGKGTSGVLRWQAVLVPGQSRVLWFKQPYVDLVDEAELVRLREISFEAEVPKLLDYWRKRLAGGMRIDVPEPALRSLYAANLWHNVITADRDPATGLYNEGVGTFNYKVFANETVMIARSMDMRGEHKEAARYLEPMLHYQGNEPLTGRFSTKEGVLHSAGQYTHGQYAMNHGFVLWGVADHYLMTRDRAYLERVAGQLVKGCDFLIRERQATMTPPGKPRSPIHGLSPASSLEDVIEFQYWFATNGFFHLGMKRVAQALADIGHPEAARLAREAEAYRHDIEAAAREAATRAAVVRLRDGSFVPYVPSRVFQWRHLTEGWIREALYPTLHLATAEVVRPDDPLITWMLDELEDNLYFSAESGYDVPDVDRNWFERGAVTLQPCLVDTPTLYMARDEVPAALRSFWNTYALSIYPDVQCFAEWARTFGKGAGPVYKTSDESRFVMWLRQLLVWEDGDRLCLGRAAPRTWLEDGKAIRVERAATIFGPVGLAIRSEANQGRIHATVQLPTRNPPREVWLRLRHPKGSLPTRVLIGGKPVAPERIVGEDVRLVPGESDLARPVEVTAEYGR
ncbi:MAG: hypothetical protein ACYC35_01255 [Pirellulales bacterium]